MMFIMMLCLVSALKKYDTDAARNELLGRILTLSLSSISFFSFIDHSSKEHSP